MNINDYKHCALDQALVDSQNVKIIYNKTQELYIQLNILWDLNLRLPDSFVSGAFAYLAGL